MASDQQLALEFIQLGNYATSTTTPYYVDDQSYKPMQVWYSAPSDMITVSDTSLHTLRLIYPITPVLTFSREVHLLFPHHLVFPC